MPAPPPFSPPSTCNCMQARRRSCRFREQVNATASRHFRAPAIVGAGFKPAPTPSPRWVCAEIFGVAGGLLPLRVAAPLEMAARHVGPIAHAKEERAGGAVAVFMQLARWMYHERARHHVDRLARGAHLSAALEAEINFGGVRMAVIGTDLARLPARHGDVTLSNLPEDLLHVVLGIPLLLFSQIEHLHALTSATWASATAQNHRVVLPVEANLDIRAGANAWGSHDRRSLIPSQAPLAFVDSPAPDSIHARPIATAPPPR